MEHVANYPVMRKLGEGATSEVFLCLDPFRNREVAVKRIFAQALRDPARGRVFRKLFFTEASLAGKLQHPHIAQIYDAGIGEKVGYIVMEYVPGGTMERFCAPQGLLPVEQVLEIAFKCARALSFAHANGIIHRDIKPGNLLYVASPSDVRIGDFGLAALTGNAETTQVTGVGSPAYMSPEQIRDEAVDHRTDLYSLGVVMYQMLCGRLPYTGSNKFSIIYQITHHDPAAPSSLRPGVPEAIDRVVRRAMQKDAAERYQSGDELAADLIEALRSLLREDRMPLNEADRFALLRSMRFFSRFTDPELWEVLGIGQWQRVAPGAFLMREGEPGDHFCLLVEGELHVTKKKSLLSVLNPGQCCGEMAYLSPASHERGASVIAARESWVVRIDLSALAKASSDCRSKFDRAFIGILAERLTLANARLAA